MTRVGPRTEDGRQIPKRETGVKGAGHGLARRTRSSATQVRGTVPERWAASSALDQEPTFDGLGRMK
jgi:hypothetical protein